MFETVIKYPLVLLAGFGVTYILTPRVGRLARRWGMVDRPGERRIHDRSTPRAGGVAVFAGFHAACALVYFVPWLPFRQTLDSGWWGRFGLASVLLLLVGLYDDWKGVRALPKLAGQVGVVLVCFAMGLRVGNIMGVDLPPWLDLLGTLAWFLVIINAFNLIDGMDGLAAGLASVAAIGLSAELILRQLPGDALIMFGFLGACLAFLRFNFHPASIFLGDSGSMFLGFVLAAVPLGTGSKGTAIASIGVPLLAVGVPIFDVMLAVWRRSARRLSTDGGENAAAIMSADSDHLHHRLMERSGSQRTVAVTLYILSAALVSIGLLSMVFHAAALGIFMVSFVIGAYVVLRHLAWIELWDSGTAILGGLHRPTWRSRAVFLYPLIDVVALSMALAVTAYPTSPMAAAVGWDEVLPKQFWLERVPFLVGIPFLLLVSVRAYSRLWSLARVSEFATVGLAALAGIVLGYGGSLLFINESRRLSLVRLVLMAGLSLPAIVGSRAFFRLVEDLMRRPARPGASGTEPSKRALLYGVDYRSTNFLRENGAEFDANGTRYAIAGVIDENPGLRRRYAQGHRVLGDWMRWKRWSRRASSRSSW